MILFGRGEILRPEEWDDVRDHNERLTWEAQRKASQQARDLEGKLPAQKNSFDVDIPDSIDKPPQLSDHGLRPKEELQALQAAIDAEVDDASLQHRREELSRALGDEAWEAAKAQMSGTRRKRRTQWFD